MLCFVLLFLTHAGGRAASATHRRGFSQSGGCNTSYFFFFFSLYASKLLKTFNLCSWRWCLWLPPPVMVTHGRECTVLLACGPGCQGTKGSLVWRCVPGTVLPSNDGHLVCCYFCHIPSMSQYGRKAQEPRHHVQQKWEMVARAGRAALSGEDEQPGELVLSLQCFFEFILHVLLERLPASGCAQI